MLRSYHSSVSDSGSPLLDTWSGGVVPPWSGMWSDGVHLELGLITLFLIVETFPQTTPTISLISTGHSSLLSSVFQYQVT